MSLAWRRVLQKHSPSPKPGSSGSYLYVLESLMIKRRLTERKAAPETHDLYFPSDAVALHLNVMSRFFS